ncbi:MAG: thiamine phosphate synthase [Blastocatellia bacterium]
MLPATKLYAITDCSLSNCTHQEIVTRLLEAGVKLIQLRDKEANPRELFEAARACLPLAHAAGARLLINDRADIAMTANADGVHLGQDDLSVEDARALLGPDKIIGVSTHNLDQFRQALYTSADYIAIGPVYATATKQNPDPVTGPEMIRAARALTSKPIVAIGGITPERATEAITAGASMIAVISALYPAGEILDLDTKPDISGSARAFLEILGG